MADFIAGSFSRIDSFRKCPKRFYEQNIKKSIPWKQTSQQIAGERVHKILELAVKDGTPPPVGYEKFAPLAQTIRNAPGQTFTEMRMTVDRDGAPCGYSDWDRAYIRVVVDVMKVKGDTAWAGDYKTGKRTFDELQLKLTAGVTMIHLPDVNTVATSYIFTEETSIDKPTIYHRSDLANILAEPIDWMNRIQEANRTNTWPANPRKNGPPFCAWCPVNKAGLCEEAKMHGIAPRRD